MVHLVARQPITSDIAKPCQRNTAAHVPPTHTSCRCDSGDTVPVWVHHLQWRVERQAAALRHARVGRLFVHVLQNLENSPPWRGPSPESALRNTAVSSALAFGGEPWAQVSTA